MQPLHVISTKKICISIAFLIMFTGCADSTSGPQIKPEYGEGTAKIIPPKWRLSEKGEFTIKFIVGEQGINIGGGIKTRFPKTWKPQTGNPSGHKYLRIFLSRKTADYRIKLTKGDRRLLGKHNRVDVMVTLTVTKDRLQKGDLISLTFITTEFLNYPAFSSSLPVASDINGDGKFSLIKDSPEFEILPGIPYKIQAIAPTTRKAGKNFLLKVVALDKADNQASGYRGTVAFISSDPAAVLPSPYTFTEKDEGRKKFTVTLNSPGYQTFTVIDKKMSWQASSNPLECREINDGEKIWWGDIHSHSELSWDGVGNNSFEYAEGVAGLDFYSLTDHSHGMKAFQWDQIKHKTIEFHKPHEFVTILGYECSLPGPSGHHNVYFNCSNELIPGIPMISRNEVRLSILNLWKYLDGRLSPGVEVITVPHHTGMVWNKRSKDYVSFEKPYYNPEKRVAIEIFSRHGTSEKYDPSNPLSYEGKKKNPRVHYSRNGPHYAQDAWSLRRRLGTVASTDDHFSHPGMPGNSHKTGRLSTGPLVAVLAGELTRDALFQAVKARRTYATTGERIILRFSLNGRPMGSEIQLSGQEKAKINIKVRGTGPIDFIEILKWDFLNETFDKDGHPDFMTVLRKKIGSLEAEINWEDQENIHDCLYYVRVKQKNLTGGHEVWAWSSPIWISGKPPGK